MAHKVFISYAAEDKHIADAVCETLEAREIKCWYAPRDVSYGVDFDETIVDAICESRLMILILSAHSNQSAHVKREIQNACMEDADVPILPFRVDDVPLNKALRYYIGAVHWLDAVTPPFESHLDNLVQHVVARLPRTAPLPAISELEVPLSDEEEARRLAEEEARRRDAELERKTHEASELRRKQEAEEVATRAAAEHAEKAAKLKQDEADALARQKAETPVSKEAAEAQRQEFQREESSQVIAVVVLLIIMIGSIVITVVSNNGIPLFFGMVSWVVFFLYFYLKNKKSKGE